MMTLLADAGLFAAMMLMTTFIVLFVVEHL